MHAPTPLNMLSSGVFAFLHQNQEVIDTGCLAAGAAETQLYGPVLLILTGQNGLGVLQ